jgi:micrococcal nuclease
MANRTARIIGCIILLAFLFVVLCPPATAASVVGDKHSMKFHNPACKFVKRIAPANRVEFSSRDAAMLAGYKPCVRCKP